jgi:hypothetical protein
MNAEMKALFDQLPHRADMTRIPGIDAYGGDAAKALENMWKDCPCLPDCLACAIRDATEAALAEARREGEFKGHTDACERCFISDSATILCENGQRLKLHPSSAPGAQAI